MNAKRARLIAATLVVATAVLLGWQAWWLPEPESPPELVLLGYTTGTNGQLMASLRLSNGLSQSVSYRTGTNNPALPCYLSYTPPRNPNTSQFAMTIKAGHGYGPTATINQELAAHASITFSIPMKLGTTNAAVIVMCEREGKPGLWQRTMETVKAHVFKSTPAAGNAEMVELTLPNR